MPTPFTFVHAADLHLDTPFAGVAADAPELARLLRDATLEAFDNLIDLCLEEQAAFLLIAGDIYDGPAHGIRAQLRFLKGMERLAEAGVEVFLVTGNHDLPRARWAGLQRWPENVHLFAAKPESFVVERDGELLARVHGVSYPKKEVTENLAAKLKRRGNEPFQIGLVHATVGAPTGHAPYAPTNMETLIGLGLDYWALGHVHTRDILREADPVIAYPGNPQGLSSRETGPRGALVVQVDEGGHATPEFRPLDRLRFARAEVSITGLSDETALTDLIFSQLEALRRQNEGRATLVKCTLTGSGPLHVPLADEEKREELLASLWEAEAGSEPPVWVATLVDRTVPPLDLETLRGQATLPGALLEMADSLASDPAQCESFAASVFHDLYTGKNKKLLTMPDEANLAEELREARDRALAHLAAGGEEE